MATEPYLAAVVQFGVEAFLLGPTDAPFIKTNTGRMLRWIQFLCEETAFPPRLIVFPILPQVGSSNRPTPTNRTQVQLVGPIDPMIEPLVAACAKFNCYVALSGLETHPAFPGDSFHTGFVLGSEGVVLRQPKLQVH